MTNSGSSPAPAFAAFLPGEHEQAAVSDPGSLPDAIAADFRLAFLIRAVEERLLTLFAEGRLSGTVHTCIGQEWTGVAAGGILREDDFVFSNHRCHGHFLARTDNVEGLIAELMGRATGVCGGRGGSQHLCQSGFFSNGVQGGIMPVAAGLALAQQLRQSSGLSLVFIGDGTLGEGAVYETLNVAAKWKLPLLVVLENNRVAQSTDQQQTLAGSITARVEAFGIQTYKASTWDPLQLKIVMKEAAGSVRRGDGPAFIQVDTDRLAAHSKGDDDRSADELSRYHARDPLRKFEHQFPALAQEFRRSAAERIRQAVELAEAAPVARRVPADLSSEPATVAWQPAPSMSGITPARVVERLRAGLRDLLQSDHRTVLLGEDIESPYGGAFKVTQGLSLEFPGRVRNCPISESLIIGLGNGLALAGFRPVCEIMFGDFLTLAADQLINHAAKFRFMYDDQVTMSLVVRTPMGGRRGYGPTHSQSLEKHFCGVPGLRVVAVNPRIDPGQVFVDLRDSMDPTLLVENKVLYGQRLPLEVPAGFSIDVSDDRPPTVRVRPHGQPDVTIVCYGEMLREAEAAIVEAFDEHEIIAEILCPTQISPLNARPVMESVRQSGRLLVVEEGSAGGGFAAEVISATVEHVPGALVRQLTAPAVPIPACAPLEQQLLPGRDSIVRLLLEWLQP